MTGTFHVVYNPEFFDVETCCGAKTVEGFPFEEGKWDYIDFIDWEPDDWESFEEDYPAFEEYLDFYKKEVQRNMAEHMNRLSNVGIFNVYINDNQKEFLDSMLKNIGFEETSEAWNLNSGNKIHMYTFCRKTRTERKKAKLPDA